MTTKGRPRRGGKREGRISATAVWPGRPNIDRPIWMRLRPIEAQWQKDDKRIYLHTIDKTVFPTANQLTCFAIELFCDQINPITTTPPERTVEYQKTCPECGHELQRLDPAPVEDELTSERCTRCGNYLFIQYEEETDMYDYYCRTCEQSSGRAWPAFKRITQLSKEIKLKPKE